jgi:hypothetical protein
VIYSRWRPEGDGYDYFRDSSLHNVNDDLPTPQLRDASVLGVPSIEAGVPIPDGAEAAGHGEVPVGVVAPVDETRVVRRTRSLAGITEASPWLPVAALGVAALTWVWALSRRK